MKRIALIMAILVATLLTGCHKEPDEVAGEGSSYISRNSDGSTSYSLVNAVVPVQGLGINCTVYEYDEADNRVDSNYIADPEYNKEYKFTPNDSCHHIKVKVCSTEKTRWGPYIYKIRKGYNVKLVISLTTEYGFREPVYDSTNAVK